MSKRAEEAALKAYPVHDGASEQWKKAHLSSLSEYIQGYERAGKDTIQRIKELLKVRIVERIERCQEDWSNQQKDRVNMRNDEDEDIIRVLEKLEEE